MFTKEETLRTQEPIAERCKHCKNALSKVTIMGKTIERYNYTLCAAYSMKPHGVLWDNEDCSFFERK